MAGAEILEISKREMLLVCRRCDDKSDLSGLCRICLTYLDPSEMKQIFLSNSTDSWKALIKSVTNVEVNAGDGLPALVCSLCVSKLNHTNEFKEKCISSDTLLRNTLFKNDKKIYLPKHHLSADIDTAFPRVSKPHEGVVDTSDLCRLCVMSFAPYDTTPIFHDNGLDSLPDQIASVTSLKVAVGDGLPARVCDCCVAKLRRASEFVEDAGAKDLHLRTQLFQVKREVSDLEVPQDPLEPDWKPQEMQEPGAAAYEIPTFTAQSQPSKPVVAPDSATSASDAPRAGSKFVVTRTFQCIHCHVEFVTLNAFEEHLPCTNKPQPEKVARSLSEASESGRKGTKHLPCTFCFKKLSSTKALFLHFINFHPLETYPFRCGQCPKAFYSQVSLNEHEKASHEDGSFQCDFCKEIFANKLLFARHITTHSEFKSDMEKTGQCDFCEEQFSDAATRSSHMLTHPAAKPYQCPTCDKRFRKLQVLKTHQTSHSDERPHKCEMCDMSFKTKNVQRTHMAMHYDEKPFACKICDRRFRQQGHVLHHMAVHAVTRPHACDQCDKTFKSRMSLTQHSKTHSPEHFTCTECGKRLMVQSYRSHMKTHVVDRVKQFPCHVCSKSFLGRGGLVLHLASHRERSKQFKCQLCPKRFYLNSQLKNHFACVHEKEKPYKCDVCGSAFFRKFGLKRHMAAHHTGV